MPPTFPSYYMLLLLCLPIMVFERWGAPDSLLCRTTARYGRSLRLSLPIYQFLPSRLGSNMTFLKDRPSRLAEPEMGHIISWPTTIGLKQVWARKPAHPVGWIRGRERNNGRRRLEPYLATPAMTLAGGHWTSGGSTSPEGLSIGRELQPGTGRRGGESTAILTRCRKPATSRLTQWGAAASPAPGAGGNSCGWGRSPPGWGRNFLVAESGSSGPKMGGIWERRGARSTGIKWRMGGGMVRMVAAPVGEGTVGLILENFGVGRRIATSVTRTSRRPLGGY
jgi:hypothetical protein